jgi:hypothetical protein
VLIIYQLDVVQDGRVKRRDALADLTKAVEKNIFGRKKSEL